MMRKRMTRPKNKRGNKHMSTRKTQVTQTAPPKPKEPTIGDIKERIGWLEYLRITFPKARNKQHLQQRFWRLENLTLQIEQLRSKLECMEKGTCQTS